MEELILEKSDACEVVRHSEAKSDEEFREGRKVGLGGSDAGAAMGLSRYKSPFMVACEKMSLVRPFAGNDATRRGQRREPWLRNILPEYFPDQMGKKITVFKSPAMYRSKTHPFMVSNLDGFVDIEGMGLGVLEIKTANEFMMGEWADDNVPDSYYAQGQHYAECLGLPYTLFFAEVGDTFLLRISPRSDAFVSDMLASEADLWFNHIEPKILPEPMGIDAEDDYLMQLYGGSTSESMIDLSELADSAGRYLFINEELKRLEAEKKAIQTTMKARIGDAKGATFGSTYKATWSRFKMERFDSDAFKTEEPVLWQKYRKEVDSGRFIITAAKGGSK